MELYSKENYEQAKAFAFISGSYMDGFFNIFVAFSGDFNIREISNNLPIDGAVILFYKKVTKEMYKQNMIKE